jgi:hypothetical protein
MYWLRNWFHSQSNDKTGDNYSVHNIGSILNIGFMLSYIFLCVILRCSQDVVEKGKSPCPYEESNPDYSVIYPSVRRYTY